jgi:uncharacterized protein HemX
MASGTPGWRIALRLLLLGGAGGLVTGLYLAGRGRESPSARLRRQVEQERIARQRAERRAEEAEHLASNALDRERDLAQRLHDAEQELEARREAKAPGNG